MLNTCILLAMGFNTAAARQAPPVYPASDSANQGQWHLNEDVSDEFEEEQLNTSKWLIQGTDGEYRSNFIGRPPSQFSTDNISIEDGKLKLETRWEPGFKFSDKIIKEERFENITTAAVISKKQFQYGYMEIRCKAADASITSSFWMTGSQSELDVFEFIGAPSQAHKTYLEKEYKFTMIDWATGENVRVWRGTHPLDWRVADDFHVYGCEWDESFLKFFADGEQVARVTKEELGDSWVLDGPMWVWVDSETFPWQGLPIETDLPADFEIEYIRVWQKKSTE